MVTGLYLWWDLPPSSAMNCLFSNCKWCFLVSFINFQCSPIFPGYQHEPTELFHRGGLGARELPDQLHEDGGDRRPHGEDQVRPGGSAIRLPTGDRGTEEAWTWQGTLTSQLGICKTKYLIQVGAWSDVTGVNFNRNFTETYSEIVESLQNKTLVVTTIMVSQVNMNSLSNLALYQSSST